jgi:putative PIN family toxin of toxin-antitoxin system
MRRSSARPRIVADTNLFVSGAIAPLGQPRRLLTAWTAGRFVLLLSAEQRAELTDVFARPRLRARFRMTPGQVAALFAGLAAAPQVTPSPAVLLTVRDAEDEHILAAAMGGTAEYLVTGDDDLLVLRDDPRLGPLKVVTVAEFLAILDERDRHETAAAEEKREAAEPESDPEA